MNITPKLKVIRKSYESDDKIRYSLTIAPEEGHSFDRTWHGNFTWKYCGYCTEPRLGYRKEKCCHNGGEQTKRYAERFEKVIQNIDSVRKQISKYVRKKESEKLLWQVAQRLELENTLLQNTSVMVGRTEIPKWLGQSYDIWMNEIDIWTNNEKSLDKTSIVISWRV